MDGVDVAEDGLVPGLDPALDVNPAPEAVRQVLARKLAQRLNEDTARASSVLYDKKQIEAIFAEVKKILGRGEL